MNLSESTYPVLYSFTPNCRKTEACAVKKSYNAIVGNYEKDVVEYVYAMDKAVGVVVLDTFTDFGELPEA